MNVYAAYYNDDKIRLSSSSGAIFYILAMKYLSDGGVVYGVVMSEDCYRAEYIRATNIEQIRKIRGSKYLQANVGNIFKDIKQDVLEGKNVLFTGTGCQINGLKHFLKDDYLNLLCVDVVCHGVPSPKLWKKYVLFKEKRNGKFKNVNFRCKEKGWSNFGIKEDQKYINKDRDSYIQMFLKNYSLRPSCYECSAKQYKLSDISIADFWGIENLSPEMNDNKGTSLVITRTKKGDCIFDAVKNNLIYKVVRYDEGVKNNPAEYESVLKPVKRNDFFEDMNNMSYNSLKNKYVEGSLCKRIARKIKHYLVDFFGN